MPLDSTAREKLRNGRPAELQPGVYGRLNPKTQKLELSTGESLPIPEEDRPFLLPGNESENRMAQKRESIQREVERTPFGPALFKLGEHASGLQFFKGLAENFIQRPYEAMGTKPGQEDMSFFERLGENKANEIAAYQNVSGQVSEENPYATAIGAVGGVGLDLLGTKGLSPATAAAGLTVGGQMDRLLENPQDVLQEGAIAGGLGYGVGKAFDSFSKLAKLRGDRRATKAAISATEAENIANKEALDIANKQGKYANELERQAAMGANAAEEAQVEGINTYNRQTISQANQRAKEAYASQKASNEQAMNSYKAMKAQREKEIFELQQDYTQQRAARDVEVFKAKQEYDLAKQTHSATEAEKKRIWQQAVEDNKKESARLQQQFNDQMQAYRQQKDLLPQLQQEAQREFSANTTKAMEHVGNVAGKDASFSAEQLGVNQFVNEVLATGQMAGSPVAREASNFLKGVFSKASGGRMTSSELVNAFKSIEGRMAKGSPQMKQVLGEFKDFMSQRLPQAVSDSRFYARQFPKFEKALNGEIDKAFKLMRVPEMSANGIRSSIKDVLKNMSPEEFAQLSRSGQLKGFVAGELRGGTKPMTFQGQKLKGNVYASDQAKNIADYIEKEANKIFRDLEMDSFISFIDTKKALGGKINKTRGFAEEIPPPTMPQRGLPPEAPPMPESSIFPPMGNLPEPVPPPQMPPPVEMPNLQAPVAPVPQQFNPVAPNLTPVPPKFVDQPFVPQQVPTLPTPEGFSGKLAAGLEDMELGNLLKTNSATDNPLVKLAGLKYVLGKAALPVELGAGAAVGGMKALTSPTAGGEVTRQAFKQGMLGLIDSMAQRYPSYRNGILDSPMDRRSLVKEIEENPQMSLEDKAIYQSRINRGEALAGTRDAKRQEQPQQ